jgi:L,D-transpeptidase catalytic domain
MRIATKLAIALFVIEAVPKLSAHQTAVIINLTEQTAYLLEDGRVAFISPIASGKEGWGTPIGSFRVIQKDLNHRSENFVCRRRLRTNSQFKRDSKLTHPFRVPLHTCSDAVPPAIPQIRRDACRLSAWIPGVARLRPDAQRPCC